MSAQIVSRENFGEHCATFDPVVDSFDSDDYKVSRSVTHHVKMDDTKAFAYSRYFASPADEITVFGESSDLLNSHELVVCGSCPFRYHRSI